MMSSSVRSAELRRAELYCALLASAVGLLQAWTSRFYVDPDGVNYLDLAADWLHGDAKHAISSFWSPAYPFLLAIALRLTHSQPYWELTVLHAVNFLLYLAALGGFWLFFRELKVPQEAALAWTIFGYTLFTYAMLFLVNLGTSKPDMGVAAVLLAATGLILRLQNAPTVGGYLSLGVLLGIGYLLKTVVLPFAFVMLFCAALIQLIQKKNAIRVLLSVVAFLALAVPLIVVLSGREGRFTIGDSGTVNYEVYVASKGQPIHPMRVVMQHPKVEEFATPVGGTYPPWHDPTYWMEGVKPRFSIHAPLIRLGRGIADYAQVLSAERTIALGLLILLFASNQWVAIRGPLAEMSVAWLPSIALLGAYALLVVESRYVAAAIVILWCVAYSVAPASGRIVTGVLLAVSLSLGFVIAKETARNLVHKPRHVQYEAAVEARKFGLSPGDEVAVAGHTTVADYWAHLAGARIIADIPMEDMDGFWAASGANSAALNALRSSGAKFLVTLNPPCCVEGWTRLGETDYYIRMLDR